MKIVIIGSHGHWMTAVHGSLLHPDAEIIAMAPGNAQEDITKALERCSQVLEKPPQKFENWQTMLDQIKPDVAVVSPQFYLHSQIAVECLNRNIHVYVEKPMATDFEQLDNLYQAWKNNPFTQLVSMQELRYLPEFVAAKKLVDKGEIGKPILLNAQKSYPLNKRPKFFHKRKTYGGTICWVGIHAIDWIQWFAQGTFLKVAALHTTVGNQGHDELETAAAIQFEMEAGAVSLINLDYLRSSRAKSWGDDRIRIMGETGSVEVKDGKALAMHRDGEPYFLELPEKRSIFLDFLLQLEGRDQLLITTEECFRATEVSLYSLRAADEKTIVNIPPPSFSRKSGTN